MWDEEDPAKFFQLNVAAVNSFNKEKSILIKKYCAMKENYLEQRFPENMSGNNRNTINNDVIIPSANSGTISDLTSSNDCTRRGRAAARIASIRVKKNLNIPIKLRQPSTGDIFEGTLRDQENNLLPIVDVTNGQIRTTRTKVIKKCNRSEAPHLPEITAPTRDVENNDPMNGTNYVGDKNQHAIVSQSPATPTSVKKLSSLSPQCSVKKRAEHFEKLAGKNGGSVQKSLFIRPKTPEPCPRNQPLQINADGEVRNNHNNEVSPHHGVSQVSNEDQSSPASENQKKMIPPPKIVVNSSENDKNKTYVTEPVNTNTDMEVTRVTRSQTHNIRKEEASSTTCSSEGDSSASSKSKKDVRKSKKLSFKCKKNYRSARQMENAKKKAITAANHEKKTQPKITVPDKKKDHEERLNKVRAAREAQWRKQHEEEVAAQLKKAEKMKIAAAEKKRLLKEEEAKKAVIAQQKKLEMEERRKREEAAREARLEEIEEEHKRAVAAYKKKKEESALRLKKPAQEVRAAAVASQEKEKPLTPKLPLANKAPLAEAINVTRTISTADLDNYNMTPDRENRILKNPKTSEDYGIDEACSSDSSEDEDKPKKKIPSWATKSNRREPVICNSYVPLAVWKQLYKCDNYPKLSNLLGINNFKRPRTSSAVWHVPPNATLHK